MKINYSDRSWCLPTPKTQREWDALVTIFDSLGVEMFRREFTPKWTCLKCNNYEGYISGMKNDLHKASEEVSIYEAVARLTTPEKSEQELKIEQLEKTINEAAEQIAELKKVSK